MEPSPDTADQEEWPPGAGNFGYFTRIEVNPLNPTPITAVAFDPVEELIWTGNENGKLASFSGENGYNKYSSFASFNSEIRALDASQYGIFSLSGSQLRAHTRQGLGISTFTSRNMENLTCMFRLPTAPTMLMGGEQRTMIQFDLEKGKEIRVATINEKNAMIIRSSGSHIYTADTEGNISQRSMSSLETLRVLPKVHGGPVQDFDISGNKLITCGCSFRVNALHGDPYVKVYDLRMFQALKPLALSFAPVFTRFLPTFYDSRVIFCSQIGEAQINDVNSEGAALPLLIESAGYALTAFGASSTYQMIAFGDEFGNMHVYSDRPNPVINEESFPTEFADSVLGLPQSFLIDDLQTPLASIPMPFSTDETLLSDWPEDLTETKFRRQRPIGNYQNVKTIQYVTYATNPKAGTPFQYFNTVPYIMEEKPVQEEALTDRPVVIPQFYRRMKKHGNKGTKKGSAVIKAILKSNKSATVPLVSASVTASTVHPIVHLLYIVPAFRNLFLCHLCEDEHCISCQLGFLFRMMSDHAPTTAACSRNLLRSMIASGFPAPWLQPSPTTQEAFTFMIDVIDKSLIGEEGKRIAELLETELVVNSICVRCGGVAPGEERRIMLTLQYANVAEHLTLCSLIEKALHQRGQREGDCPACKTKTRLEETRKVKHLPPILMIDANPSAERYQLFWEEQLKISERRPKYNAPVQEFSLGCGSKPEKTCRYGTECRNKLSCKYSHGMGDWETECETWLSDTGGEWRHFVSKSFSAKLSNGIAILSEQADPDGDQYDLVGAVMEIVRETEEEMEKHVVTLLRTENSTKLSWVVVNDVLITEVHQEEALHLDHRWKLPLAFIYASRKSNVMTVAEKRKSISVNVFQTDCNLAGNDVFMKERSCHAIPGEGEIVGIDAEFVDVGCADSHGELGKKTVGRVSCVDSTGEIALVDDYVITCVGTVVDDYLTPYSGIMEDDLNPDKSTKHLTTLKRVYLKLLHLVEKGVIFVGHGLQNDFAVLNIYVPPEQIRDTVHLFHLPDKRYISLQFLAWHVLGERIQETTHDSVVDARIALQLYNKYLEFHRDGTLLSRIQQLYETGNNSNWRLSEGSPTKSVSPISSLIE